MPHRHQSLRCPDGVLTRTILSPLRRPPRQRRILHVVGLVEAFGIVEALHREQREVGPGHRCQRSVVLREFSPLHYPPGAGRRPTLTHTPGPGALHAEDPLPGRHDPRGVRAAGLPGPVGRAGADAPGAPDPLPWGVRAPQPVAITDHAGGAGKPTSHRHPRAGRAAPGSLLGAAAEAGVMGGIRDPAEGARQERRMDYSRLRLRSRIVARQPGANGGMIERP